MKLLLSLCLVLACSSLAYGQDCAITVPANALTAAGMGSPWLVSVFNPANGPCNNSNPGQTSFVQGAIINLDTGLISIYNPLAIDVGAKPAFPIIVPVLPTNYVAAFWFGTNAMTLTLINAPGTNSLQQASCVNGGGPTYTIFGQYSYCNAPAFWDAVKTAVANGQLVPPPILNSVATNMACPSTRDFGVVDQDQSDNVVTTYLVDAKGRIAQDTAAHRRNLTAANKGAALTVLANGSDNRLVAVILNGAFGCTPYTAPDLADPGQFLPALPLNELQAAVFQAPPVARIPSLHAMTLDGNGAPSLEKMNAYRRASLQVPAQNFGEANTTSYCINMYTIGAPKILATKAITILLPSPDPANTANLFAFLVARFNAAIGTLTCPALTGAQSPLLNTVTSPAAAAPQALTTGPVLDPPTALLDNPAANNLDPATLQMLCQDPMNNPNIRPAAGFTFDGASFGIGIGASFGAALILGAAVTIVKRSRSSADTQGRVAGDFGVRT